MARTPTARLSTKAGVRAGPPDNATLRVQRRARTCTLAGRTTYLLPTQLKGQKTAVKLHKPPAYASDSTHRPARRRMRPRATPPTAAARAGLQPQPQRSSPFRRAAAHAHTAARAAPRRAPLHPRALPAPRQGPHRMRRGTARSLNPPWRQPSMRLLAAQCGARGRAPRPPTGRRPAPPRRAAPARLRRAPRPLAP